MISIMDDSILIKLPKNITAEIIRIEPIGFTINKYYVEFLKNKTSLHSGKLYARTLEEAFNIVSNYSGLPFGEIVQKINDWYIEQNDNIAP